MFHLVVAQVGPDMALVFAMHVYGDIVNYQMTIHGCLVHVTLEGVADHLEAWLLFGPFEKL